MSKIVGDATQLHEAAQNVVANINGRPISLEDLGTVLELVAMTSSELGTLATRLKTRFDTRAREDTTPWNVRDLYGEGVRQQLVLANAHHQLCSDWRETAALLGEIDAAQRGEARAKRPIAPDAAHQVFVSACRLADFANLPAGEDGSLTLQVLANAFYNITVLSRRLNNECCDRAERPATSRDKASYADLASLFKTLAKRSEGTNRGLLAASEAYEAAYAKETSGSSVAGLAGGFDQAVYDLTETAGLPRLPDFPDVMASLASAMDAISSVGAKWRRACTAAAEKSTTAPAAQAQYERLAQSFADLGRSGRLMSQAFTQAGGVAEQLRKQASPATL